MGIERAGSIPDRDGSLTPAVGFLVIRDRLPRADPSRGRRGRDTRRRARERCSRGSSSRVSILSSPSTRPAGSKRVAVKASTNFSSGTPNAGGRASGRGRAAPRLRLGNPSLSPLSDVYLPTRRSPQCEQAARRRHPESRSIRRPDLTLSCRCGSRPGMAGIGGQAGIAHRCKVRPNEGASRSTCAVCRSTNHVIVAPLSCRVLNLDRGAASAPRP